MVFQQFNLFPHKTVLENITLAPIKLKGLSKEEADKVAFKLLKRIGLEDKASVYPNNLSGGQKQRIAIARALVTDPYIILADEPTGSLDHDTALSAMNLLIDLNRTEHTALVVVTHAADLARRFEKVYTLYDGKLALEDKPEKNR